MTLNHTYNLSLAPFKPFTPEKCISHVADASYSDFKWTILRLLHWLQLKRIYDQIKHDYYYYLYWGWWLIFNIQISSHLDGRSVLFHSVANLGDNRSVWHSGCGAAQMNQALGISKSHQPLIYLFLLYWKKKIFLRLTFSGLIYWGILPSPQSAPNNVDFYTK